MMLIVNGTGHPADRAVLQAGGARGTSAPGTTKAAQDE